jgi:pimeloyl-ACP methyl ester carboxylesterase
MLPFASVLHRLGADTGLATWTLRYEVRGWNGAQASPLPVVRSALDDLRRQHGGIPVVLVGHSMGGRAAMRVAGDPSVVAVAGLAPWLPDGEPVEQLTGRRVLIAHGDRDGVTSPRGSRSFAERAAAVTDTAFVTVRRERHAMLLRPRVWHRLTAAFVLDALGWQPMPAGVRAAVTRGWL